MAIAWFLFLGSAVLAAPGDRCFDRVNEALKARKFGTFHKPAATTNKQMLNVGMREFKERAAKPAAHGFDKTMAASGREITQFAYFEDWPEYVKVYLDKDGIPVGFIENHRVDSPRGQLVASQTLFEPGTCAISKVERIRPYPEKGGVWGAVSHSVTSEFCAKHGDIQREADKHPDGDAADFEAHCREQGGTRSGPRDALKCTCEALGKAIDLAKKETCLKKRSKPKPTAHEKGVVEPIRKTGSRLFSNGSHTVREAGEICKAQSGNWASAEAGVGHPEGAAKPKASGGVLPK